MKKFGHPGYAQDPNQTVQDMYNAAMRALRTLDAIYWHGADGKDTLLLGKRGSEAIKLLEDMTYALEAYGASSDVEFDEWIERTK